MEEDLTRMIIVIDPKDKLRAAGRGCLERRQNGFQAFDAVARRDED